MSKRLFLAIPILPGPQLLSKIKFLEQNLTEEWINWTKEGNMHLTLKFIGKTPGKKIVEIADAIENCLAHFYSFTLTLDQIGIFGSNYNARVLWLGPRKTEDLLALHTSVIDSLERIGIADDRQNFVPHFTLARFKKIKHKDHFRRVIDKLDRDVLQETEVKEIVLFESILTAEGPIYKTIKKFPLKIK